MSDADIVADKSALLCGWTNGGQDVRSIRNAMTTSMMAAMMIMIMATAMVVCAPVSCTCQFGVSSSASCVV